MTVFLVEVYGGKSDDHWNYTEGCFNSAELAEEYIEKKKKLIKRIQGDEEEFSKLFNTFCDEIDTDGEPYFNVYGASFEDFINKLETYKDRNEVIGNFLTMFNRQYIKQMHKFFMDDCMLGNSMKSCNIEFYVRPLHVNTSLLEVSEYL
jgi:hypothetical protein